MCVLVGRILVTWSAGDLAPGARGTVCLGSSESVPLITCVRVCGPLVVLLLVVLLLVLQG